MNHKTINQPTVSIILPTYNRGYCLERTLKSVLHQSYGNWELIIVDNFSSDDTDSIISRINDSRIILEKVNNNGIVAVSRNKGLDIAKGRYVAFLDSDDWWLPEKLQISIDALEAGAKIVYHDLFIVEFNPPIIDKSKLVKTRQVSSPVFCDLLLNGPAIANSSVVVERELLNQAGRFSEDKDLIAAEDYEAWIRLSKYTEAFTRLKKPLGYYWAGGGNMSSPEKTFCYLIKLKEMYGINLKKGGMKSMWFSYNLALVSWILGNNVEANRFAREVFLNKPLSLYSLKLVVTKFLRMLSIYKSRK